MSHQGELNQIQGVAVQTWTRSMSIALILQKRKLIEKLINNLLLPVVAAYFKWYRLSGWHIIMGHRIFKNYNNSATMRALLSWWIQYSYLQELYQLLMLYRWECIKYSSFHNEWIYLEKKIAKEFFLHFSPKWGNYDKIITNHAFVYENKCSFFSQVRNTIATKAIYPKKHYGLFCTNSLKSKY